MRCRPASRKRSLMAGLARFDAPFSARKVRGPQTARVPARRSLLATATAGTSIALLLACCGSGATTTTSGQRAHGTARRQSTASAKRSTVRHHKPTPPPYARLLAAAQSSRASGFVPVAVWNGQTAAWAARTPSGIALLSFDQRLVELHLHSGTIDAGSSGWRWGPTVAGSERRHLLSAFNGAFKLSVGAGGFESYGRTAASLQDGLGSIVTYRDGYTDIGTWHGELPAAGRRVASVRQNLKPLIDRGRTATNLDCLICWGATLGGVTDPARSALGITADGRLIWAGGEHLTTGQLADALINARVVRAVELDINPEWVAAYLYGHRGGAGPLASVPMVPGQPGVPGQFLAPYSRDFFTIATR